MIAKNPEIKQLIASGHRLSPREENEEYKKIVQTLSPLVGYAGVSIEVFADLHTTSEEMLAQGEEMFSWIPNACIKYPCTLVHHRPVARANLLGSSMLENRPEVISIMDWQV